MAMAAMTWLPMINGLMGDPELRERYQFWFFSYPTGNPLFYSASLLRDSLEAWKVRTTWTLPAPVPVSSTPWSSMA